MSTISKVARDLGAEPRIHRRSDKGPELVVASLDDQIAHHQQELERLKLAKAQRQLRFELGSEEGTVVIHGVTDVFIRSEGLARLREFIQKHVPQK